jgi:DNA-binding FadR family transcriptional regulator
MFRRRLPNEFIRFLATTNGELDDPDRLPSLGQLSTELGISVAKLREQMEVARALGYIEVRPRTGIRRLPFTFTPAVRNSLMYAISLDPEYFEAYAELRNQVESSFWCQAVKLLEPEDHDYLQQLITQAWEKLRGSPIRIPHREHRELHLAIYRRLGNPFVLGILEAFWDAYEAFGLNLYADYGYLEQVWDYHQHMVDAICDGDLETGYQALTKHKDLLHHRPDGIAAHEYGNGFNPVVGHVATAQPEKDNE